MSDGSYELDETPTLKLDKIQMAAMMATLMKETDKKLQFERGSFATDNVLGTSSQARKTAREKRKGKRPAAETESSDKSSKRVAMQQPNACSARSLHSNQARAKARLLRSDRASIPLGRYVATELKPKLGRYVATELF
ncbi:hypothetical protein DY000_02007295 [Brassica cretica]|uniref:Uncharacterized protein n=2 Tax=Brassica cretica TaxID=69181 RepID=A0ABQ7BW81_BRACR|nr:hypothetical protein DY000_02007295 [Brassica cretica]